MAKNYDSTTKNSKNYEGTAADVAAFDHIILGCPAMGNEELEEYEFEPFFADILPQLKDKTVGIFGSYAWNQGDWIENWKNRLDEAGVKLAADPVKAIRMMKHWKLARSWEKQSLKRKFFN